MKRLITYILILSFLGCYAQNKQSLCVAFDVKVVPPEYEGDYSDAENMATYVYPSKEESQKLVAAFINHIKKNGTVENLINGNSWAPGTGMTSTFSDLANGNKNGSISVSSSFSIQNKGNIVVFNPKDQSIIVDDKKALFFNDQSQEYDLYINKINKGGISEISTRIGFFESWQFDQNSGQFSKEVHSMVLYANVDYETIPLFHFRTNPYSKSIKPSRQKGDYIITDPNLLLDGIVYRFTFPYTNNGSKVKLDELCTPLDYYNYSGAKKTSSMFYSLIESAVNGTVNAYEISNYYYSDNPWEIINMQDKLSVQEITDLMKEQEYIYDDYYNEVEHYVEFSFKSVCGAIFTEDWYFDSGNFSFKKVVYGLTITKSENRYSEWSGEFEGRKESILFFLDFGTSRSLKSKNIPFSNNPENPFRIIIEDKKYGLGYQAGKIIVEPMYDYFKPFSESMAIVKKDNKAGVINTNGEIVVPLIYDDLGNNTASYIESYKGNLDNFGIRTGIGKCGIVNLNGKEIIPCLYDKVSFNNESLTFELFNDSKAGIADSAGTVLLPCEFSSIKQLSGGQFIVKRMVEKQNQNYIEKSTQYGLYDKNGIEILSCEYDDIYAYDVNTFVGKKNNAESLFVLSNGTVDELRYDVINSGYLGVATVVKDGKYGAILTTGKEIIECKFDYVQPEQYQKLIMVYLGKTDEYNQPQNGKKGLYTLDGKQIYPVEYDDIVIVDSNIILLYKGTLQEDGYSISEGKFAVGDGQGRLLCDYKYNFIVASMSYGRQPYYQVYKGKTNNLLLNQGKFGLVDSLFNEVVACKYDWVYSFNDFGVARVFNGKMEEEGYPLKGKFAIVDKTGKELCAFKYDWIDWFSNGFAKVTIGNKIGYIDSKGKEVIPVKYDAGYSFEDNGTVNVSLNGEWIYLDKTGKILD